MHMKMFLKWISASVSATCRPQPQASRDALGIPPGTALRYPTVSVPSKHVDCHSWIQQTRGMDVHEQKLVRTCLKLLPRPCRCSMGDLRTRAVAPSECSPHRVTGQDATERIGTLHRYVEKRAWPRPCSRMAFWKMVSLSPVSISCSTSSSAGILPVTVNTRRSTTSLQ